jgi:hypothetical protein
LLSLSVSVTPSLTPLCLFNQGGRGWVKGEFTGGV